MDAELKIVTPDEMLKRLKSGTTYVEVKNVPGKTGVLERRLYWNHRDHRGAVGTCVGDIQRYLRAAPEDPYQCPILVAQFKSFDEGGQLSGLVRVRDDAECETLFAINVEVQRLLLEAGLFDKKKKRVTDADDIDNVLTPIARPAKAHSGEQIPGAVLTVKPRDATQYHRAVLGSDGQLKLAECAEDTALTVPHMGPIFPIVVFNQTFAVNGSHSTPLTLRIVIQPFATTASTGALMVGNVPAHTISMEEMRRLAGVEGGAASSAADDAATGTGQGGGDATAAADAGAQTAANAGAGFSAESVALTGDASDAAVPPPTQKRLKTSEATAAAVVTCAPALTVVSDAAADIERIDAVCAAVSAAAQTSKKRVRVSE